MRYPAVPRLDGVRRFTASGMIQEVGHDAQAPVLRKPGNSYNIFILVLTIFSLALMVLLLLPVTPAEHDLLMLYDNVVCVIFLIDFAMNIAAAKPKRAYFIGQRGWLDLLGSIPSFGFFPITRAAPSRPAQPAGPDHPPAARPGRQGPRPRRAQEPRPVRDVHHDPAGRDRALAIASILVLEFESRSPDAQHHDRRRRHLVGHRHDHHGGLRRLLPGDPVGRLTAIFVMFAGIGIIGALASILASLLVSPASPEEPVPEEASAAEPQVVQPQVVQAATGSIAEELAGLRAEVAGQRAEIAALRSALSGDATTA